MSDNFQRLREPEGIWGVFVLGDFLRIFVFGKGSDHEAIKKEVEKMKKE